MDEVRCPGCGALNPGRARFCLECGTALVVTGSPAAREVRKVVTVLFADITGSTAIAEHRDPEAVRALLARYFAAMRDAIEHHGGTVEKFIGDAVMAVFGIPAAHEDDALRAVRAARDMGTALDRLNAELGAPIRIRIGVNSGEVVAGTGGAGQTLVTGDTVNVAARLEQAAAPGDILLGDATVRLTRGAVDVEPAVTLTLRGRSVPVQAHRLRGLLAGTEAAARHAETSMVGRDSELARLEAAFERVAASRQPILAVVVGTAGVGKSRLVREFIAAVPERATVLRGRCLPYGQGITFWPVGEIVRAAVEIEESDTATEARARLQERITAMPDARHVGAALERLLGLGPGSSPVEELSWATRRLLEELSTRSPTIVLIEDIHWAEPALLDLIDHVVVAGRGPLLILAPSRPEIAEARPAILVGERTLHLALEPLGDEAASELVDQLLPGAGDVATLRQQIAAAADGNPLYVEELVGMLIDDATVRRANDGSWVVVSPIDRIAMPATIGALLTARLDQLGSERSIAERGSVVGRVFESRAVAHLSPELATDVLDSRLDVLVGRDLIRPEAASIVDELAYRFRHILIRDAAYESLPKLERARLHESLADWLEAVSGDRLAEIEEIVGYHQEQA
ncbi:MAG TPA: adenylate/guanylate cyclase domain-containing protein, partial [Candidatus Limnocylindrales bacterium]|nr:adenylate/guanylate cyclase domain-containing protein [Candidatus Limnocylindrales bacterium]